MSLGQFLIVTAGIIGSGKSALASGLARVLDVSVINTDRVRKDLAGLDPMARGGASLYTPDRLALTYEESLRQAHDLLRSKSSVILDGTFSERRWRQAASQIAVSSESRFALVEVRCANQEVLQARLARRRVEPSISDATDEHLPELAQRYEPVDVADPAPYFSVHTDVPVADVVRTAISRLRALGVIEPSAR